MNALWEILQGRLVRRGVPTKNLTPGEIERAANDTVRRVVTLQQGIPTEAAKEIVKFLKDQQAEEGAGGDPGRPGPRLLALEGRPAGGDAPAARARFRRRAAVRQLPRLSGHRRHPWRATCIRARRERSFCCVAGDRGRSQRRCRRPRGQQPQVNADARVMADFEARVKAYVRPSPEARSHAPEAAEGDDAEQIDQHQRALAQLIAHARSGAQPGTSSPRRRARCSDGTSRACSAGPRAPS